MACVFTGKHVKSNIQKVHNWLKSIKKENDEFFLKMPSIRTQVNEK